MRKMLSTLACLATLGSIQHASADEYGCKVLMCLSNPQGPMAVQQCHPPMQKFLEGQAKKPKDPFPRCEEAANTNMQSGIRQYDRCPEGTGTLAQGAKAIRMSPTLYAQVSAQKRRPPGRPWAEPETQLPSGTQIETGIGDGENQLRAEGNKICVGKELGTLTFNTGTDEAPSSMTVTAFEQLATVAPASTPRVVDIYIDQKLYRSVRY